MFGKKTKRVLVVGSSGFIGSHLIEALKDDPNLLVRQMDLRQGPLNDVSKDHWHDDKYDVIVFLACKMANTREAYQDNVVMLASLQKYVEAHPKTHVIYTSSAAVYPDEYRSMIEEDVSPVTAPTIYGQGKLVGEMVINTFARRTILRLSNVHGKGGRGVIDRFKRGERTVYGTGMQVRDFVEVSDVVKVILAAIADPKKWQGTGNVSSGRGQTILSMYRQFGKGSPIFVKALPGDVKFSVLDNSRLREMWR